MRKIDRLEQVIFRVSVTMGISRNYFALLCNSLQTLNHLFHFPQFIINKVTKNSLKQVSFPVIEQFLGKQE